MDRYTVYVLRCPDTNAIRYVGYTDYPERRKRSHCSNRPTKPKTPVQEWTASLIDAGKCAIFEIFADGFPDGFEAREVERAQIKKLLSEGYELLNVACTPKKKPKPKKNKQPPNKKPPPLQQATAIK
jgi:hypothetical protein